MTFDADVIVAGAGPAGSHTARLLADAGHGVVLIDENEAARSKIVCTGIVGSEAYREVDLPPGPIVDEIERAEFVSPSGVRVLYEPDDAMAMVVDRTRFDDALADRAVEAGAELRRGHAARSVHRDDSGVTVEVEVGRERRSIRGRSLVVATGHQRWLHEEAGLGVPEDYVHGVHADLPFEDLAAAELYFGRDVAPGFFAWAVPFGVGTARLGVLSDQGSRKHFRTFLRHPEIRDRLGISPDDEETVRSRLHSRAIVQGPVTPSASDRVLAVGEAAGQVKTTTAGGIYYGLLGAEVAAEVLGEGLRRNWLGQEHLHQYDEVWTRRLGNEIRAGLELQRLGAELDDEQIEEVFLALKDGWAAAVRQVVRFDWHRSALGVLFGREGIWRSVLDGGISLPLAG